MQISSNHTRYSIAYMLLGLFVLVSMLPIMNQINIQLHQQFVQSQLKQNQKKTILDFSIEEWSKIKQVNNHEILVKGQMFDIHSVDKSDGHVYVTGQYDSHEDQMLKVSKQLEKKSDSKNNALPFFNFLFCESFTQFNFYTSELVTPSYCLLKTQLCSSQLMIESPPPKV